VGAYQDASGQHGFQMIPTQTPTSTPTTTPTSTPTTTPTLVTITAVRAVTNQKNEVTRIVLAFAGSVNPAEAGSLETYRLTAPGKHGASTATNAKTIRFKSVRYNAASNTVTLVPKTPFKITKPVEVLVEAFDSQGQLIDGDQSGRPGGNAIAI